MKTIDALGQACPMPVILTRRALKENLQEDILVQVDNEIATQNLKKMADHFHVQTNITKRSESLYEVHLSSAKEATGEKDSIASHPAAAAKITNEESGYVVLLHSDRIGEGNEELGRTLMKSFLFSLTEQEELPQKVLFYNSAAYLAAEGSAVLEDLKALEEQGVEILTCGLCVEFYGLKGKIAVGEITNMYRIVEIQRSYKTVTP